MTVGPTSELISIVDADPDLGELLTPDEREKARRQAVTRVRRLSPGEWKVSRGDDRLWVLHGNPPDELRSRRFARAEDLAPS